MSVAISANRKYVNRSVKQIVKDIGFGFGSVKMTGKK